MPIVFDKVGSQWPVSAEVRRDIAEQNKPIILSFSRGKDSIAAWLGMLDSGVDPDNIIPVYYYRIPGMKFTEESLQYFEEVFGKRIIRMPHPSLYEMLRMGVYQPPTRSGLLMALDMPTITYQDIEEEVRRDRGLPDGTLVATGVRAADSIARRTMLKRSGPLTREKKRLAVIWDWRQGEVYGRIAEAGIELPPDYEIFNTGRKNSGRTFDGIAYQFLKPIRDRYPDDYETILEWFPMADLDIYRNESVARND